MKKLFVCLLALTSLSGCHLITSNPGEEVVLVSKPWFAKGQVFPQPLKGADSAWVAITTDGIRVSVVPTKYTEAFDDLSTSNNNFIDYDSYLSIQVIDSVSLVNNFGAEWYKNNVREQYRTIVRDVVRKYPFTNILSDPGTTQKIENEVRSELDDLIKKANLPIRIVDMSLGKAMPNKEVVAEMNRTAAQQQQYKTLTEAKNTQTKRAESEQARAKADNAYRNEMNLTTDQFISLAIAREYASACRAKGTTCYVFSDKTPVVTK